MKTQWLRRRVGAFLVCCLLTHLGGWAGQRAWAQQQGFTPEQLDRLLAPIALYPDPLLAQMLPAATFVTQIQQAAKFLAQQPDPAKIDSQPWDISVKAVAHYPQVVKQMNADLDWTTQIGQAVVGQQKEVMQSIQRLRAQARAVGTLQTTEQQKVIVEGTVIKIVPAQPTVIYVPVYNPQVVYVQQPSSSTDAATAALIGFGVGLVVGSWLNNSSCDWYHHSVYYRGAPVVVNRTIVTRPVHHDIRYNTWSGTTVSGGAAYNPATGKYGRGATTYNPYTGRSSAAATTYNPTTGRATQGAATYNPYTGQSKAVSRSANAYTGRTSTQRATTGAYGGAARSGSSYNAYTGRSSASASYYNPRTGNVGGVAATTNPRTGQTHVRSGRTRR